MAGAELAGMGSLEDILMDAASEESITESNVISTNGSTIVETSFTESGTLGLDEKSESPQIYAIDMDISETMGTLKNRAAEALHIDLLSFKVTVLSEKQLGDTETLQQQCGTDSGLVQIQFVLRSDTQGDRLDILDVLKPNEGVDTEDSRSAVTIPSRTIKNSTIENRPTSSKVPKTTRWIVCPTFKELQKCLKIPQNPLEWSVANVRQWLSWAVCQFGLTDINLNGCTINGPALFNLSQTDFRKLIPEDPGDVFYMHFELLRRTNVVAVVCDPNSSVPRPAPPKALFTSTPRSLATSTTDSCKSSEREVSSSSSNNRNSGVVSSSSSGISSSNITGNSSLVGSNGTQQIQLWQFLLEMLTDPKLYPIMSWCGSEGEFRLHQPEVVANLWGQRKSKPNMNYEKLSRALRYYYDGDMIAKVSGKRFVYRFVLDLKSVVGYTADELRHQVEECAARDGLSLESVNGASCD